MENIYSANDDRYEEERVKVSHCTRTIVIVLLSQNPLFSMYHSVILSGRREIRPLRRLNKRTHSLHLYIPKVKCWWKYSHINTADSHCVCSLYELQLFTLRETWKKAWDCFLWKKEEIQSKKLIMITFSQCFSPTQRAINRWNASPRTLCLTVKYHVWEASCFCRDLVFAGDETIHVEKAVVKQSQCVLRDGCFTVHSGVFCDHIATCCDLLATRPLE